MVQWKLKNNLQQIAPFVVLIHFYYQNDQEFTDMVKAVLETEVAIAKIDCTLTDRMLKSLKFSRSLCVVQDISQGSYH